VAYTWGESNISRGDIILLTEMEHHSNLVPWQLLAQRKEATLRFLPLTENGELDLSSLDHCLNGPVKLLAFTHISNVLGTINPVGELCASARAKGVTTLVDAAQSVGHIPVNVGEIGCDFLAFSGHKMCGPTGIGVLFGKAEILSSLRPFHGGGEMVAHVDFAESSFKPPPQRFEAGTPPIAQAIGLGAACDYLADIGCSAIQQHGQLLAGKAHELLRSLPGLRILGPQSPRGSLISFTMEGVHPHDIASLADHYGLALRGGHHCAQPLHRKLGLPASCRASFYFYNTEAEVGRMADILREIQNIFA